MVAFTRYLLSFLSPSLVKQVPLQSYRDVSPTKSIAIVGAGSAGLAALKALLDIDPRTWEIVLYEERENIGGIWYILSAFLCIKIWF
jgi:ribulose 1,5-bisphosphate synthetase/thiazole synthase